MTPRVTSLNSTMAAAAEVEASPPRQSVQSQMSMQGVQPMYGPQPQPQGQKSSLHPTFDSNRVRQYVPYRPAYGRQRRSIHEMPG